MDSLERAKDTTPARVIYSLGIPGIGAAGAKLLCRHFADDLTKLRQAGEEELSSIDGIGPVLAGNIFAYFQNSENNEKLDRLLRLLRLHTDAVPQAQAFSGMTFVITGSLEHFSNRSAAKEWIESLGGKVTGSVTKKTNYLINNDNLSGSSKNQKAKELQIPILSEQELLDLAGQK